MKKNTNIKLNEELRMYLLDLLNKRFYKTVDVKELRKINQLYEALDCDGVEWLASVEEY